MSVPAVLHPDIVEFLREQKGNYLQEKVWECVRKLKEQQFDGGLRVKKLKGTNKRVWEARINSASRLIFTYDRSTEPKTGKPQVYLAIQDICIDHDDVSRKAKARRINPDAEWLNAEEVEVILETKNFAATANLTEGEKTDIDAIKAIDFEIAADFTDELLGNIQWQVLDSELEWQRAIIRQDADLQIKLTPEEYELAKRSGNLLLSGNAGTGKTTVALYRLLQKIQDKEPGKRLYIAGNPLLVNNAKEQFHRLLEDGKIQIAEIFEKSLIENLFEFKTIRQLCLEILENSGDSYSKENEVNFLVFSEMYRAHSKRKQYPNYLVWDEIRSIIKGKQLSVDEAILSKKEYDRLGKFASRLGSTKQRLELYKIAQWYQKKLEKYQIFDEIDLVRKAVKILKETPGELYQSLVCDEVQDFTELQLELLFELVPADGNLLFAGDLNQTIGPSGFRWEELKQKFYPDREVEEKTLNFNFRSVGSLVKLANQVLKIRSRLLKETTSDRSLTNSSYGQLARAIAATGEILVKTLQETSLYPGDAILVRTEMDKEKFRKKLNSSFVFTIEEAKGLEFDTVFLVEFFKPTEKLWKKVMRGGYIKDKEKPLLQLELNLLYVAITRASRILNIWESKLCELWEAEELTGCLRSIIPELVRSDRIEPSAEAWRKQGLYYMKAEFYQQAKECFVKSEDAILEKQAQAKYSIQTQEYSKAARIFEELEAWEDAAPLWEKTQQWQEAASSWEKAGDRHRQEICEAHSLEASNQWALAAAKWEKLERPEDAKRCWMNIPEKRAEYYARESEEKKQWLKAAREYEKANLPQKAALCRAREWERKKQWQQAMEEYQLAGYTEEVGECRKQLAEELFQRALSSQERGDNKTALVDFNGAIELAPEKAGYYNNRGISFARMRSFPEAIADFEKALQLEPEELQSYHNLGAAYAEKGDLERSLESFSSGLKYKPDDAQTYYNMGVVRFKLGDKDGALADYTKSLELKPDNAETYYNRGVIRRVQGDLEGALADMTEVLRLNPRVVDAYIKRGVVRFDMKDTDGAIEDFERAMSLNPKSADAYYNRAVLRRFKKDLQGAFEDFSQVLLLRSDRADAYVKRGAVQFDLGNSNGALEDFSRAMELKPDTPEIYYNRGNVYRANGNFQKAAADLERAIEINPDYYQAHNDLGIVCLKMEDISAAMNHFNKALEIHPNYPEGYNNRGYTWFRRGEYPRAIADLTEAVRINPDYAEAHNNLGNARLHQGDYQGAVKDFTETIRIYPDYVAAYNNRGFSLFKLGDYERAIADCKKCLELSSAYPLAYYNLGLIHLDIEDLNAALDYFNRSLELDPKKVDTYINRGIVHLKLKNYIEAIADETVALQFDVNLAQAYYVRGEAERELGKYNEAIADFDKAAKICQQLQKLELAEQAQEAIEQTKASYQLIINN
ncbi:MAG: tetratricopeptide repeat protein [Cyanobacteriota bacterium]|nr:tetratricopeptide repeat protein [Cyanobacteriota bacterium]